MCVLGARAGRAWRGSDTSFRLGCKVFFTQPRTQPRTLIMKGKLAIVFIGLSVLGDATSQTQDRSIEGFWQDSARRTLFSRKAPPGYEYGRWTSLDLQQTYPSSKHISKSAEGFAITDLLYGRDYDVALVRADERSLEFTRTEKWSSCTMHHVCRLENAELFCSLENICMQDGDRIVDWRGEERYVRRAHCERVGREQALGIPNVCR